MQTKSLLKIWLLSDLCKISHAIIHCKIFTPDELSITRSTLWHNCENKSSVNNYSANSLGSKQNITSSGCGYCLVCGQTVQ